MDETIQKLVAERRRALHGADDGRRPWGLALSGGGIRSATFCLGLLKALAVRRQLLKFDLMSTVSGGGYIGAALGRLCTNAKSADEVRAIESALGDVDRARFGWWLRANGRYLIPGGMRDTLFATALYLRNLLATHIELAIAASLIGMVLAATNLLLWDAVFRAVDLNSVPPDAVVRKHPDRCRAVHAPGGRVGHAVADAVVHAGRALPRLGGAGLRLLVGARPTAIDLVDAAAGRDVAGARHRGRLRRARTDAALQRAAVAGAQLRGLRGLLGDRAAVGAVPKHGGGRRPNCATS